MFFPPKNKKRPLARGVLRLVESRLEEVVVFLESDSGGRDRLGESGVTDVAEVPRLVGIAGNIFFSREIVENETELGEMLMNLGEDFGFGNHCVVVADGFAVFNEKDVDGESGMVFRAADGGEILFAIFWTKFGVGRPGVPDFLLFVERAVDAVEFNLDSLSFEEVGAESFELFESFCLNDVELAEGVLADAEIDHTRPLVGELVLLVDENEIGVVENLDGDFGESGGQGSDEEHGDEQGNDFLHDKEHSFIERFRKNLSFYYTILF